MNIIIFNSNRVFVCFYRSNLNDTTATGVLNVVNIKNLVDE